MSKDVELAKKNKSVKDRSHLKVLVVDDNAFNLQLLDDMLTKIGHNVFVARDGKRAVSICQKMRLDIIFIDIYMPEMGGYDAVRLIRKMECDRGKRTPIVAVTAETVKGTEEECLKAGMDGYIIKPVKLNELLRVLELVSKEHSSGKGLNIKEDGIKSITNNNIINLESTPILRDDPVKLKAYVKLLIEDLNNIILTMENAISNMSADELKRAAHTAKGMVKHIKNEQMLTIICDLESLANNRNINGAKKKLTGFKLEFNKIMNLV